MSDSDPKTKARDAYHAYTSGEAVSDERRKQLKKEWEEAHEAWEKSLTNR